MSLPGPSGLPWALGLLGLGVLFLPVGECLRRGFARFAKLARSPEPVERLLLDFYLGGAAIYVLAALPVGAFSTIAIAVVVALAAALLAGVSLRRSRSVGSIMPGRDQLPAVVVFAIFLLLFAVEISVAESVPSGNSFDSSLLTTYTALLLSHHSIPLTLLPIASQGVPYPQGTTVWLGVAQMIYALPPARVSLLVTPLFLALPPVAGYVVGRRALGSATAGLALAVFLGLVASWTRVLVAGSNDFVLAFPLVLLLFAWSARWEEAPLIQWGDVLLLGMLAGYSAALNPVGAEILLPFWLILGLTVSPRWGTELVRWLFRWGATVGIALLFILPSLFELALGHASPNWTPGAVALPSPRAPGINFAQFVGLSDPFLFGPDAIWLSPIPFLRDLLAILLVAGAALGLGLFPRAALPAPYRAFLQRVGLAILLSLVLLLGFVALQRGVNLLLPLAYLSSAGELSIYLFTFYALLASLSVTRAFEMLAAWLQRLSPSPGRVSVASQAAKPGATSRFPPVAALAVALIVVVPGVSLTVIALPPVLGELYAPFGNVTDGDFALLDWAQAHLPATARVLVAPGSAAEFLPGYMPMVRLLFPMGPVSNNATYQSLVALVDNGTLGASGRADLSGLGVQFVAVTGMTNRLYEPFLPTAFQNQTAFPLLFHDGDAYVFAVA